LVYKGWFYTVAISIGGLRWAPVTGPGPVPDPGPIIHLPILFGTALNGRMAQVAGAQT